jgi:hypothetical protein
MPQFRAMIDAVEGASGPDDREVLRASEMSRT